MIDARKTFLFSIIALGATALSAAPQESADLVLHNGKVVAVDAAWTVASAIAVRGHEIVAVGDDAAMLAYIGADTEVVDLHGRLAIPGFIEGHGHFSSLGESKMILDLTVASSWNDIVGMVEGAARQAEPGTWILGRGWHQEKWNEVPQPNVDGVPLHHGLSEVSPDNPVLLEHASGHAAFANARAMELAGIDTDTPDPAGGTIVREASGAPTGLLRETAQRLPGAVLAEVSAARSEEDRDAEFRRIVQLAGAEALAKGVTSFQDAGSPFAEIDRYRQLAAEGVLPVRLYVMVRRASNEEMDRRLPQYRIIPEGNDFLAVRAIKRQVDGALGSHGAWLLEPYADLDSTGLVLETLEDIEGTARVALKHGFQVNTHAIGDRANREILDLYARAFAGRNDAGELRWRIEHAQHVHPDDVQRFADIGVIASMQGVHCTSDAPWVPTRLGQERAEAETYLWRSFLDAGVVVTNGTDVPVEAIDPIASYYASVSRRMANGEVFVPAQRMTREEALRSYTIANAYAAFEEHLKGSLEVGKLADIVVLSRDILTVPEAEILQTQVDLTIVGGQVRYRR